MRLSSQEEYGLRCLLRVGREGQDGSITIGELSRAEGISEPHVAKMMRILRKGGFVRSTRGQAGGYTLARPADQIAVGHASPRSADACSTRISAARTPAWARSVRTWSTARFGRCGARSRARSTECSPD